MHDGPRVRRLEGEFLPFGKTEAMIEELLQEAVCHFLKAAHRTLDVLPVQSLCRPQGEGNGRVPSKRRILQLPCFLL